MGIEPTLSAWKAEVLPLNYTRNRVASEDMVEGGGFEPPKDEPADLQSAPFDRSGTPPKFDLIGDPVVEGVIVNEVITYVNLFDCFI